MPTIAEGVFARWQPRYAEHGIPTFPVGAGKRPAVRGYLRIGADYSRQLAIKFPAIDAFGITLGGRNRITVLDVDTSDERVLADALSRHGNTPFIVRSGSGHWQAWYRHSGEPRKIRPDPATPIDVLGGGFVVAPPSLAAKGRYELISGALDDLATLPAMKMRPELRTRTGSSIPNGNRNDALFRRALVHARAADDFDALLDAVSTENEFCLPPLDDHEVEKVAKSAWKIQLAGKNWVGVGGTTVMHNEIDDLAASDPDALALLLIIRRNHGKRDEFVLANAMAEKLKWGRHRFVSKRRRLEEYGAIECIHRGGRGQNDPPIYRLKVSDSDINITKHPSLSPSVLHS